jgi:hypothetical protein
MQNETTRHKGKQEERQAGRQDRRQYLGKADTPSNTKADTLRKPSEPLAAHCMKKNKIRPPATKGNKKKDKLGDKLGDKKEDKLGDKGDKTQIWLGDLRVVCRFPRERTIILANNCLAMVDVLTAETQGL